MSSSAPATSLPVATTTLRPTPDRVIAVITTKLEKHEDFRVWYRLFSLAIPRLHPDALQVLRVTEPTITDDLDRELPYNSTTVYPAGYTPSFRVSGVVAGYTRGKAGIPGSSCSVLYR
jgi:hypothetical protein